MFFNNIAYCQSESYQEKLKKTIYGQGNIFSFDYFGKIKKKDVYGCGTWGESYCGFYYYSKQRKFRVELRTEIKTNDSTVTMVIFKQNIEGLEFKYKINENIDSSKINDMKLINNKYFEIDDLKYYVKKEQKDKYKIYMIIWNKTSD